jgi:Raf kinase inhibitor-like YbhB/YbcL family protein
VRRALGFLLKGRRAGEAKLAWNHLAAASAPVNMTLTSDWFEDGGLMPERSAGPGIGANRSPPLAWSTPPAGTRQLALIIEDPDAPLPRPLVHLVLCGLPSELRGLAPGDLNGPAPGGGCLGRGTFGRVGYSGPRPLPGHGPHRYVFQLLALDRPANKQAELKLAGWLEAICGHVIGRATLTGVYQQD